MQTTGTVGLRPSDSAVGAPQIDVQMPSCMFLPGMDEDLGDGAAALERADRRRHRVALGEHDAAADRIVALRRGARPRAGRRGWRCRRRTSTARSTISPITASSPVERAIAGGRGVEHAPAGRAGDRQLGAHGIADVELGRVQRHRHAERCQPVDEVTAGGLLVGRARLTDERHEAVEQRRGSSRRTAACASASRLVLIDGKDLDTLAAPGAWPRWQGLRRFRARGLAPSRSSKNIARLRAGVGGVSRLTTTKASALIATPTSTESMPCAAKLRCSVNVQTRHAAKPATIARSRPAWCPAAS